MLVRPSILKDFTFFFFFFRAKEEEELDVRAVERENYGTFI